MVYGRCGSGRFGLDVLATDVFGSGRFGYGRFGLLQVQSWMFWPNTISTQKELSFICVFYAFIHTVYVKQKKKKEKKNKDIYRGTFI